MLVPHHHVAALEDLGGARLHAKGALRQLPRPPLPLLKVLLKGGKVPPQGVLLVEHLQARHEHVVVLKVFPLCLQALRQLPLLALDPRDALQGGGAAITLHGEGGRDGRVQLHKGGLSLLLSRFCIFFSLVLFTVYLHGFPFLLHLLCPPVSLLPRFFVSPVFCILDRICPARKRKEHFLFKSHSRKERERAWPLPSPPATSSRPR